MLPTTTSCQGLGEKSDSSCFYFYCLPSDPNQLRDVAEGADIIMVKPTLPYLDILADAAQLAPNHPLACYQVSGEFAMIHAGAAAGVYDLRTMASETADSMLRAGKLLIWTCMQYAELLSHPGATLILTYFTPDFLDWLDN